MACLRYSSYLLKDSATANTVIDNSFGTPQNDLQLKWAYRKIVICTRPLFVPAVLVRILNLLSKIGLLETP